MKILVVTESINASSGGPTRSCKGMCNALSKAGAEVSLLVLTGNGEFEDAGEVKVLYGYENLPNIAGFDVVHIQGMWHPLLHRVQKACYQLHVPYVISPRGMLDPWALSVKKWKKRLALFLYQRKDLEHAAAFCVTAEMERDHVRDNGLEQPCIIAANGVEMPAELPERKQEGGKRIAIFLSRLHPGKGLLTLAEAWAKVRPKDWIMKVVGPDSYGHKADVIAKLEALGIRDEWEFHDAMNDHDKWAAYRSAEVLIHPSVSENFGITIAEGLYAGLPVICTKGTPWKDVVDYTCGLWIDQGVEPLTEALETLLKLPTDQLSKMGDNGHQLIVSKYSWSAIAKTMLDGYKRIVLKK